MKAYTDLKQSRKLAKILPIESADMVFTFSIKEDTCIPDKYPSCRKYSELYKEFVSLGFSKEHIENLICPCWSLAALLNILPNYHITNNGITGVVVWSMDIYSKDHPNLIDACVEMIELLHKQKLL